MSAEAGRLHDVGRGVLRGLALACILSAFVVVIAIAQGSTEFPEYHANLFEFLAVYFVGGVLCGAIAGWFRALSASTTGTVLVGIMAGAPFWFARAMMIDGNPLSWSRWDWSLLLFMIVLLGPFFARSTRAK